MQTGSSKSAGRFSLMGAIISGLAASLCCVLPLVLLALGVGGAWVSRLRFLEPYRPLFIIVTLGFLGFAFYLAYRKPRSCSVDGTCGTPASTRASRAVLWIVTLLLLGVLIFPYLTPHLFGGAGKGIANRASDNSGPSQSTAPTKQVVLKVEGMDCAACSVTIHKSLTAVDGVKDAKVTFDPPQAVVVYDPAKVSADELTRATDKVGYPSTVEISNGRKK